MTPPRAATASPFTLPGIQESAADEITVPAYVANVIEQAPNTMIFELPAVEESAAAAAHAAADGMLLDSLVEPRDPKKDFRRFTLIDPNRLWVMCVAIALLGGILAASLVSSFTSVYASAEWVGLPSEVQWLPVVILDVAIVGFSWALMVFSTRAADQANADVVKKAAREKVGRTRFFLIWVTSFSVVANLLHTYDHWADMGGISTPQAIFGIIFSACIPLWALAATEELIRLVFVRRKQLHVEGQ